MCSAIRKFVTFLIFLIVIVSGSENDSNESRVHLKVHGIEKLLLNFSHKAGSDFVTKASPTTLTLSKITHICASEPFGNDSSSSMYWRPAEMGSFAITNWPCIQRNGLPLTRKCVRNEESSFPPAVWEKIPQNSTSCMTNTRQKLITNTLVELENEAFVMNKTLPVVAAKRLKGLLRAGGFKLIPTDLHLTSRIIKQAVARFRSPDLCLNLLGIYNLLMGADKEVLRASTVLNATNALLANFETCIDATFRETSSAVIPAEDRIQGVTLAELGVRAHLAENLSVIYIDPDVANVLGIALYDQPSNPQVTGMFREAFGDFYYRFLYPNDTVEGLLKETGLQMATYVPYYLWKNLTRYLPPPSFLILKVYSSDAFFKEARLNTTRKVFSKIASLSIPGVSGSFGGLIPMIFYNQHPGLSLSHNGTGCGYWNYDTWVSDGIELIQNNSAANNLIACGSHHMTQFAYLIGGDYRHADFSDNVVVTNLNVRALNIITLVGCTLSILGLLGIFITSLVFKSWRSKASSKVLLHLCTAIIFQMILFCFVNTQDMTIYLMDNEEYAGCIVIGALLHYSVLVEFTWMLLIAFFQFQRYVQVFGSKPKHFVLKSAIVGWGVPIIPPAILVAVDRRSYIPAFNEDTSMTCYPSGNGLNFGVILPIVLIIAANLVIFVMVIWNIHHTMVASSTRNKKRKVLQQIRLMTMMFFLFGFSWIFGLLAAIDAGLVFSYLFCITATLQGFVLFVYFVVLDPVTRKMWYQICWNAEDKLKASETMTLGTSLPSRE